MAKVEEVTEKVATSSSKDEKETYADEKTVDIINTATGKTRRMLKNASGQLRQDLGALVDPEGDKFTYKAKSNAPFVRLEDNKGLFAIVVDTDYAVVG